MAIQQRPISSASVIPQSNIEIRFSDGTICRGCIDFKIKLGKTFEVYVVNPPAKLGYDSWFMNSDPCLYGKVSPEGEKATIETRELGNSVILLDGFNIRIKVGVYGEHAVGFKVVDLGGET